MSRVPIGLDEMVERVQEICSKSNIYRYCNIKTGHYIVNLDAGNGQITLTDYISDAFFENKIRHFGGLDLFLEYKLDGTMAQLQQVFQDISDHAVYMNEFAGVISMDITGLASHINEAQVEVFLSGIGKLQKNATMIFYVPSCMNRNILQLVRKIYAVMDEIEMVQISPYTIWQMAEIVKEEIEEMGVELENTKEVDEATFQSMEKNEVLTAKEAVRLAGKMVREAEVLQCRLNVCLEELGNIGGALSSLPHLMSAGRSRNIRCQLVLQSLSQLDTIYGPSKASTIRSNADVLVAFRMNHWETLVELSNKCGEREINRGGYCSREHLISPAQLAAMKTGQALVMISGRTKFISWLPDYSEMYDCSDWEASSRILRGGWTKTSVFDIQKYVREKKRKEIQESENSMPKPSPFFSAFD